jgi:type I restriction enzyme, S subunit
MTLGIDELPEGWALTTCGDVVRCSKEKAEPGERDDAPYLSLEHIEAKTTRILGHGRGSDVKSVKNVFHKGDVLYGKLRPYLNKVCLPTFDGICSTDILVLKPSDAINAHFFHRLLTTAEVVNYAIAHSNGINLPRIAYEALSAIDIALPPLPEQRRIVAKIEALHARSRKVREALEVIPPLIAQFRQSVLAAAFRGDLTAEWREQHPDVEPAAALLDRIRRERCTKWEEANPRKKYHELDPVDDSDLPELPEGWCYAPIEELTAPGRPIIYGIIKPGPDTPNGVPYVRVTEMKSGTIDLASLRRCHPDRAALFSRATLQSGDILVSKDGTIGKVAIVPLELEGGNITQHLLRVSPSLQINGDFLARMIESPTSQQWIIGELKGIGLEGVNVGDFRRMPIPVAPLGEQQAIVDRVHGQFLRVSKVAHNVAEALHLASHLDQSILAKAFNGELVPQDPKEEPASMLLERIRAAANGEPQNATSRRRRRRSAK